MEFLGKSRLPGCGSSYDSVVVFYTRFRSSLTLVFAWCVSSWYGIAVPVTRLAAGSMLPWHSSLLLRFQRCLDESVSRLFFVQAEEFSVKRRNVILCPFLFFFFFRCAWQDFGYTHRIGINSIGRVSYGAALEHHKFHVLPLRKMVILVLSNEHSWHLHDARICQKEKCGTVRGLGRGETFLSSLTRWQLARKRPA